MKIFLSILLLLSMSAKGQIFPMVFRTPASTTCTIGDADAQKYIDSVLLTTSLTCQQKQAIDTCFKMLKDSSVYTVIKMLHFHWVGDQNGAKWNAVNPSNTDAAHRLTYAGTVTYSSSGGQGNGSTGYADTHFNTSTEWTSTSASMGIFVENNSNAGSPYDMACSADAGAVVTPSGIISRYSTNTAYGIIGNSSYNVSVGSANSIGSWIVAQTSLTNTDFYKNGSNVASQVSVAASIANQNLYLWANNGGGTAVFFSDKKIAVSFAGDALSDSQVRKINNCIEYMLDKLGIGVQ